MVKIFSDPFLFTVSSMTNDDKEAKVAKRKTRCSFGNLPCKTTTKKTRNLRYINKNRGEKYKLTVFVSLETTQVFVDNS